MNNVLLGGDGWVHYETLGGGQGGRPWADGMSGVHTAMTNTLDTPVEALERALPVRVRRYGLRRGSGGAGAHAGGDGIVRELEALAPITVSLVTERRVSRPWGLGGGAPGAVGENWLLPGGDENARPPPAGQVHRDARARRRAARAHSGRRGLGTACLTAATISGAAARIPGAKPGESVGDGRHVARTHLDAAPPGGHSVEAVRHEHRVAVAHRIECRPEEVKTLGDDCARVGGCERCQQLGVGVDGSERPAARNPRSGVRRSARRRGASPCRRVSTPALRRWSPPRRGGRRGRRGWWRGTTPTRGTPRRRRGGTRRRARGLPQAWPCARARSRRDRAACTRPGSQMTDRVDRA